MAYTAPAPSEGVRFSWISEAFELFKQQPAPYITLSAVLVVISVPLLFFAGIQSFFHGYRPGINPLAIGSNLGMGVINAFIMACLMNLAVQQLSGKPITAADAIPQGDRLVMAVLYALIAGLCSSVAWFACIVPTFFVQALLAPGLVLVLTGSDIGTAIQSSVNGMKPYVLMGALFYLVLDFVWALGAAVLYVGLVVTIPIYVIATALAARDLLGIPGMQTAPFARAGASAGAWPSAPPEEPGNENG